jgi:heat shock protein HslJ
MTGPQRGTRVKAAGFRLDGDQLVFTDARGDALFTYVAPSGARGGTARTLTGLDNGRDAVEGTALTEQLTMSSGPDDHVSSFGDCNQLKGTYTQGPGDGLALSLTPITANPCPPANTEIEQRLVAALAEVTTADQHDATITMRAADGTIQVVARRTR